MSHPEKVKRMIADLAQRGVPKGFSAPPLYRLLWAFGSRAQPPLFQTFAQVALSMGILFGSLWGVTMWWLQWREVPLVALISGAFAGLLFGAIMAAIYRRKAKTLDLPPWDSYP